MGAPAVSVRGRAATAAPSRSTRSTAASRSAARVATPSKRTRGGTRSSAAARPRPRAKAATQRRSLTPPGGVAMIPLHAVGGAAGAVGGIADSGFVVGMTRGRLWIGVLGLLLGGIVALNVWGLSLSASTNGTASKIDELERSNTVLSAKIAKRTSSDRVQALAAGLGLDTPTPKAINYLKVRDGDAATAAKRIGDGEISVLAGLPIAPAFGGASLVGADAVDPAVDPAVAPVDPTVVVPPVDPAADPAAAAAPEPEVVVPVAPDPAAAAPPAAATPDAGGGVTP